MMVMIDRISTSVQFTARRGSVPELVEVAGKYLVAEVGVHRKRCVTGFLSLPSSCLLCVASLRCLMLLRWCSDFFFVRH